MKREKINHGPDHKIIIPIGIRKALEIWFSFGESPKARFSFFFCKFPKEDDPYVYNIKHFNIG